MKKQSQLARLPKKTLGKLIQANLVSDLSSDELHQKTQEETLLKKYLPERQHQIDPRDQMLIVYSPTRAQRPHTHQEVIPDQPDSTNCPICQGKTTGIIDTATLSKGDITFINKNLFPAAYPFILNPKPDQHLSGLHLLQWSSRFHHKDWHNLPLKDCQVVLERLVALEKNLLFSSPKKNKRSLPSGYLSIIKNAGPEVGSSLSHGHQQIIYSNHMPARVSQHLTFFKQHQRSFTDFLLKENPAELMIKDYGPALLLVPYFMRRPYTMVLILKDATKQHLSDLSEKELAAIAQGWRETSQVIHKLLPQLGKSINYNVLVNTGPGSGIYLEFLPHTQIMGGFEHLGFWVCQDTPQGSKDLLDSYFRN